MKIRRTFEFLIRLVHCGMAHHKSPMFPLRLTPFRGGRLLIARSEYRLVASAITESPMGLFERDE
jgi:hypothetical protein